MENSDKTRIHQTAIDKEFLLNFVYAVSRFRITKAKFATQCQRLTYLPPHIPNIIALNYIIPPTTAHHPLPPSTWPRPNGTIRYSYSQRFRQLVNAQTQKRAEAEANVCK